MTLVTVLLLAVGCADLARWSPEWVSWRQSSTAVAVGILAAGAGCLLLGFGLGALPVTAVVAVVVAAWVLSDAPQVSRPAVTALAVVAATAVLAVATIPLAPPPGGALARWYGQLGLPGLAHVPLGEASLAGAAGLALLATTNRVVRAVLAAAGTPASAGETHLRGGRLLGPMERIFVFVLAVGGNFTAAAIVVAAKSVLRLPEIRSAQEQEKGKADLVAEYYLIGTFASWLLALALAGLVRLA